MNVSFDCAENKVDCSQYELLLWKIPHCLTLHRTGSYLHSAAGETRLTVTKYVVTMTTNTMVTLTRISPQQVSVFPGAAITMQVTVPFYFF
jgi:FPC/CPF motif-containing protein YcgG